MTQVRKKKRRYRRPQEVTPARWVAWRTLMRTFTDDAWTDRAFSAISDELKLSGRERAFAQLLTYGSVQHAKKLDHVIGVLGKRPLRKIDPPVLNALRIGAFELLVLGVETGTFNPDDVVPGGASAHAAVSQAIELVRGVVGERAVAFTNAILRRAQVDGIRILNELDPNDLADRATLLSMPEWLVKRVYESHNEMGLSALAAQNTSASRTVFRINTLHHQAESVSQILGELNLEHELVGDTLFVSGRTGALSKLIDDGLLLPQSLASQMVSLALDPHPGERVLDMCAAPGGKTTHIAALMQNRGEIVAVELHQHRADSIRALTTRTGCADLVQIKVDDATTLTADTLGGRFDRILLDAPCTGSGVLSGRPDARWKRSESDIEELASLQKQLLHTATSLLKPGGVLVYSTCSILSEENEEVASVDTVYELGLSPLELPSAIAPQYRLDARQGSSSAGHAVPAYQARTWPHKHETDGFYLARFTRPETEEK